MTIYTLSPYTTLFRSLIFEISDLLYHTIVMMEEQEIDLADIKKELTKRFSKKRNKKEERKDIENRSEEHTSELQSRGHLVCRLLLEKKKKNKKEIQQ